MGKKISSNMSILLVLSALMIDAGQFFLDVIWIGLIVNHILDIIIMVVYRLWFGAIGVKFKGMRAIIYYGLSIAAGITALPLWTMDILAVIIISNMSARLGKSAQQIVDDPRTRKILNRGIMRASQRVSGVMPRGMRNQVEGASSRVASSSSNQRIRNAPTNDEMSKRYVSQSSNNES